ncbi:MAG: hypothetical protein EOP20_07850 [Hyphomicrobiales bacterium]|nr:MAG: hypothetical protein EOP20_07850 [Hyphomicrobiales bacterium]
MKAFAMPPKRRELRAAFGHCCFHSASQTRWSTLLREKRPAFGGLGAVVKASFTQPIHAEETIAPWGAIFGPCL